MKDSRLRQMNLQEHRALGCEMIQRNPCMAALAGCACTRTCDPHWVKADGSECEGEHNWVLTRRS